MSTPPVLVYIVEDNSEHRTLLHDVLEPLGFRPRDFASAEELLAAYDSLSPGILLLDLKLPGMGGAQLTEELAGKGCWWPAIILTAHPDAAEAERARRAGAFRILPKPIKGDAILEELQEARKRLETARVGSPNPGLKARFEALSPGELKVLEGMREGLKTKQIAARCGVSERTVRTRMHQMLDKTGADSKQHLLQLAVTAGMPVKQPTREAGIKPGRAPPRKSL